MRPNHYEVLGLAPSAANDEIAKAFARETGMFRPHAFGGITELCVAYETLRDPIKRRAYDASLGFEREPRPFAPRGRLTAPPAPLAQQAPAPPAAAADAMPRPQPQIGEDRARYRAEEERFHAEAAPIEWKRTGAILGGIVVAACLFGGIAGWWSAHDIGEAEPPKPEVSVPLPPAKAPVLSAEPLPAPILSEPYVRPARPKLAASLARKPAAQPPTAAEEQPQALQPEQSEPGLEANEESAAEAPAATVASAMPLPGKVIARTIQRIGYACGAVASTSPVEGRAPGVFKVTCTSGQSYQASPVNGRYRFRRW